MALQDVHTALNEEIEFLAALQVAAAPFAGTSQEAARIIGGWKGTLAVLISELEYLKSLNDADLKARLQQEIDLNKALLGCLDPWKGDKDADSWRSFFEEEIEIADELIRIL